MTGDIAAFVRARLDEDETAASAASDGPWESWRTGRLHGTGKLRHVVALPGQAPGEHASISTATWMDSEHIARHDPERVLREVAAKRAVIELHSGDARYVCTDGDERACDTCGDYTTRWPCGTVRNLAAIWSDHPDYRSEWRP